MDEQWRARLGQCRVEHDLGLQARDTVDGQAMLALEILDRDRELLIVDIVRLGIGGGPVQGVETASEPSDLVAPHTQGQEARALSFRLPHQRELAEPIARQLIERYPHVVLTDVERGGGVVESGQHDAVALSVIVVQREDRGPVEGPHLSPRSTLIEAGEARLLRLSAGIVIVAHRCAPERQQPTERPRIGGVGGIGREQRIERLGFRRGRQSRGCLHRGCLGRGHSLRFRLRRSRRGGAARGSARQRCVPGGGGSLDHRPQGRRRIAPDEDAGVNRNGDARKHDRRRNPPEPQRGEAPSVDFTRGLAHECGRHLVRLLGVGAEQSAIAAHVDDARDARRQAKQLVQRRRRENLARGTGDAQSMTHVFMRLVLRERIQVIASRDALGELAKVGSIQELAQLRLADQDDLQELVSRRLQVREQAHLLEHVGGEILEPHRR